MKLYLLNGKKAGEKIELVPPGISIGRELDNDLNLLEEGVSRYHAKIELTEEGWIVKDLKSTNGVKVNGIKVESQVLKEGDEIKLGNQLLRFGEKKSEENKEPQKSERSVSPPLPDSAPKQDDSSKISADKFDENQASKEKQESEKSLSASDVTAASFDNIDFFGKGSSKPSSESSKNTDSDSTRSKKHAGLLFYVVVLGAAVIFISLFWIIETTPKPSSRINLKKKEKKVFVLSYEKQIASTDNIFRYALKIENNVATVTLDDLKYQRHYKKSKEIAEEDLTDLKSTIKHSKFFSLQPVTAGVVSEDKEDIRKLMIIYGKKMNVIVIKNTFSPSSFEEIENAIEDFSSEILGIRTLVLTAEEMKEEAEKAFRKAQDLFMNYDARPENLKESIKRYRITMDFLEQFVPKPEIWNIARKKLQEAISLRKKILKEHWFNAEQALRLKNFVKARDEFAIVVRMTDPDERRHKLAKRFKNRLDSLLRRMKRR